MRYVVRIDHDYEDGVSRTTYEAFDAPMIPDGIVNTAAWAEWWEMHVWDLTGTGRDSSIAAIYTATIIASHGDERTEDLAALGSSYEWGG